MVDDSEQKIILLTGASRGIGHATVRKFSEENWRVITCSRQAFDTKCPWPGGEANHVQVDLSNPNNTLEAIDEVKKRLNGKLHALVNNAGISPKGENGERLDTLGTDLSIWGKVFHVNFFEYLQTIELLTDKLNQLFFLVYICFHYLILR